ncbi:MAG: hypothetical protein ACRBF0_05475 [Calditrichia bacterium]
MATLLLIFFGTFWEASMDLIGTPHNFEASVWKKLANWFDAQGRSALGNRFWDNRLAWRNKWKDGDPANGPAFPGASTVFVTFMDGWHVVKFFWLMHVFAAIVFYEPISGYFFVDMLIIYCAFGLGHELFFLLLQDKKLLPGRESDAD